MNYFAPKDAAERYAKGRPDVHGHSIDLIRSFLRLDRKVERVLDIACGTGLSTKALLAIGEEVYGTAESQPFENNTFDLITVSSGIHWFEIDKFLPEARRILKSSSWLVLYENYFNSAIEGIEGFAAWFTDVYLRQFPTPPRNNRYNWADENLQPMGLHFITELRTVYSIPLTKKQLALYLTTQSNIIAKVEGGRFTYGEVQTWLHKELTPFFPFDDEAPRAVSYGNWIKFIQRMD
jgi:ubiquinone/menaquinone biosynthesis C-methylase UbiE